MRGSAYRGEGGFGFGFASLNVAAPLSVIGGHGNGGGTEHTAHLGVSGEF